MPEYKQQKPDEQPTHTRPAPDQESEHKGRFSRTCSLCRLVLQDLAFSPSRNSALQASEYRFLVSLDYMYRMAALAHLLFIPLFAYMGAGTLALFNILSVAVFLYSAVANRLGHQSPALLAGLIEIITHSILATYTLGWDSGFQYYLIAAAPAIFLHPTWRTKTQLGIASVLIATYLVIDQVTMPFIPRVDAGDYLHPIQHLNAIGTMLFLTYLAWSYRKATNEVETALQNALANYDKLAHTDPLTGLPNRRAALEFLRAEESRFQRNKLPFVVSIADLDDFKAVNDHYGHDIGDSLLEAVAGTITSNLRHHDFAARWGGEEFLLILPETRLNHGGQALDKVRDRIKHAAHLAAGLAKPVTMTIGFSLYDGTRSLDDILKHADKALYQGKQAGKDRVCTQDSELPGTS